MSQTPDLQRLGHFDVRLAEDGPTARVVVTGEIDIATSPVLQDRLMDVEATGPRDIVVDLSEVTFVDSSGIRTFVHAARRAEQRRTRFRLIGCSDAVLNIFELTGIEGLLEGIPFSRLSRSPRVEPGSGRARRQASHSTPA